MKNAPRLASRCPLHSNRSPADGEGLGLRRFSACLRAAALSVFVLFAGSLAAQQVDPLIGSQDGAPPTTLRPLRFPLAFVSNEGQWDSPARFVGRAGGVRMRMEPDALALELSGEKGRVLVRLAFERAAADPRIVGEDRQEAVHHYFVGNDPERWQTEVPLFSSVRYEGLWPGIDLRVRERAGGGLEYDLLLEPGADLSDAVLRCEGIEGMRLLDDGSLVLDTAAGPLRQTAPVAWQIAADEGAEPLESCFRLLDGEQFGFEAARRDPSRPMVIDPGLVWGTFLGSTSVDYVSDVAFRGGAELLATGITYGSDFPTTPGVGVWISL